jgi:hypothetical protein
MMTACEGRHAVEPGQNVFACVRAVGGAVAVSLGVSAWSVLAVMLRARRPGATRTSRLGVCRPVTNADRALIGGYGRAASGRSFQRKRARTRASARQGGRASMGRTLPVGRRAGEFKIRFAAQLATLEAAKVHLTAFELGNEINGPYFNGDFQMDRLVDGYGV